MVVTDPASKDRHVRIYEVGPRDGLQNESRAIATADKLRTASPWVVAQLADIDHLVTDGSGELTRPYTSTGIDVVVV